MEQFPWLLVVAGGPLLLAVAFAYVLLRRRRLTPSERVAQHEAIEDLYDEDHAGPAERPKDRTGAKG